MRLSRPCYDKPHRCPGWNGGGMKYAKRQRCQNGTITTRVVDTTDWVVALAAPEPAFKYPGEARWRFGHCNVCDVVTWPFALRKLDPTWWPSEVSRWWMRHH